MRGVGYSELQNHLLSLNMKIEIRQAKPEDALTITELYLASRKTYVPFAPLAHTDSEVAEWISSKLIPSGGLFVAESCDGIVGMLSISRDDSFGWVDNLYLDPSLTGLGVGSKLLTYGLEHLDPPVRLYTFQRNIKARKFYKERGFREIELSDGSENEEKTPDVLMEWAG